jgi:hypothetical protein
MEAGWRVFVELTSRISSVPVEADRDIIRHKINSMSKIRDIVRDELKQFQQPRTILQGGSDQVETVLARILNGPLRTFLDVWPPRFQSFDKDGAGTVPNWEKGQECVDALGNLLVSLNESAGSLGTALGLRDLSPYLPA